MKALEAGILEFVERLKQEYPQEIARNPRDFKKKVLKLIRRTLPPKRGRPASPQFEAALAMLRQGKSIRDVLRAQINNFDNLDAYGRYLAEKGLRQALTRRGLRMRPSAAVNPNM